MSWVKPFEPKIGPDRLKALRGIHPDRPTPGPADFDTLSAYFKSSRHKNPLNSAFGRSRSDRQKTSHLGKRLEKGGSEPGPGAYHIDTVSEKSPWKHLQYGGRLLNRTGGSLSRTGRDSALKLSSIPQVPGELPTNCPGPGAYLDARWKPRRGFKFPKQASFNRETSFKEKKKRIAFLKKFPNTQDPALLEPAPNRYRPKTALVEPHSPEISFQKGSRWPGDHVSFANMNGDYGSKNSHTRKKALAHAKAARRQRKTERDIEEAIAAVMEEAENRRARELRGGGDV